jgi:hypothetical protein
MRQLGGRLKSPINEAVPASASFVLVLNLERTRLLWWFHYFVSLQAFLDVMVETRKVGDRRHYSCMKLHRNNPTSNIVARTVVIHLYCCQILTSFKRL